MAYRALEKLINLHDGYRKVISLAGRQALLLQENGTPRLIDRHCPHAGQVLDAASVSGDVLTCPKHAMQFSLHDGRVHYGACAPLVVHTLVYEGNSLGIDE
ncbi:MAG: Rieske 2Fe-2S domain-containing protein [Congregibacter sp.]|nr:Rieske 2Fe-2S domain-containing protein [Congregibacter sp.]